MNKGISRCTGDVIGFLNSDDFYANNHVISEVSKRFADSKVEICFGDLCYVDPYNIDVIKRVWTPENLVLVCFQKVGAPTPYLFCQKTDIFGKRCFQPKLQNCF